MAAAVVALLATGCTKDDNQKVNDGRIKIFAEGMTAAGGNTKLLVDPANLTGKNGIQWKAGETVNLNGTSLPITGNTTDGYTIDPEGVDPALAGDAYYAIYPGNTFGDDGNSWTVTNGKNTNPSSITLISLNIKFRDGGKHDIVFPMATKIEDGATEMQFKHLTAGFRMTLHDAKTSDVSLTQIKVYVYGTPGDAAGTPIASQIDGMNCNVKWANEGPMIPIQDVGQVPDDEPAYGSEMVFNLYDGDVAGVNIAAGDDLTFCIPVTLATVKKIAVVGYNNGTKVFTKISSMTSSVAIERNKMYSVKSIDIN